MEPLLIVALSLIAALLIAAIVLLSLLLARGRDTSREIAGAISQAWVELGLGQSIGQVRTQAEGMQRTVDLATSRVERQAIELRSSADEIRQSHASIQQMLRSPIGRASFGELALEILLADQLPPSYFGIREKCFAGKIPDAHIKSTDGLVCVDSKFPLENFARLADHAEDSDGRVRCLKDLLRDAERHLRKIADDYVRPDYGTAPYAFMFVPSEAVYYCLATEGHELLRRYIGLGVHVLSPLLLAHKLELIKLGVRALRLNENARTVLSALESLAIRFRAIDEAWQVFHGTHLRNAERKAAEIDEGYKRLHLEFLRIQNELLEPGKAAGAAPLSSPNGHAGPSA